MKINLKCGDCLDILREMEEETIDCVITSPPYDNLRTYNGTLDWNFGKFKDIALELYRVLKKGGVIVWVVGDATVKGSETGTSFKQALHFKEIGFNLHDTMIWFKPNCFNFGSNNCYKQSFEYMFIFSKGKPKTINLIKDIKAKNAGKVQKGARKHANGQRDIVPNFVCSEYKRRFNVWDINLQMETYGHPATFPEQLAHDHIVSWTNEGDTVLDCFMGSGTVGKMCKLANRNFIGIELVPEYFKIAEKRIKEAQDGDIR